MKALVFILLILATPASAGIVESINSDVNSSMYYRPDYGGDKWSLSGRYGDCEDFALRKIQRLQVAGIPARIGVYYLPDGRGHAVAIAAGVILDNRTKRLRPASSVKFLWTGELRDGKIYMVSVNGKPIRPMLSLKQPVS